MTAIHRGQYSEGIPLDKVPRPASDYADWEADLLDLRWKDGSVVPCGSMLSLSGAAVAMVYCTLPERHGGSHVAHGAESAISWVYSPPR
jgi:hypothetical protein